MDRMRRYIVTSLVFMLVALGVFVFPQRFSRSSEVTGQKRGAPRGAAPAAVPKGAIDYSKTPFSHTSRKEHQEKCSTCHKVPTKNWQTVKRLPVVDPFPDVANFPDHVACVRCHRAQFFKGAQPGICFDCHTKSVSPKNGDTLAFPNANQPGQFTIVFPHDKHQDVLATLPVRPGYVSAGRSSFVKAAHAIDDKAPAKARTKYNNCEICHDETKKKTGAPPTYAPLKTSPETHASCFNCHWSGQKPTKDECEGCHIAGPPLASFNKRISPQFTHDNESHTKECTACHINITKAATLRGLKPDVPISSCVGCHNDLSAKSKSLKIVKIEMTERADALAKNKTYVCTYCHGADKGKLEPPPEHYHAVKQEPPKPKDLK